MNRSLPIANQPGASPPGDEAVLRVAETFTSIQGEGILTGVPSHFIRLSGCNLRCVWCDTPYASWSPEGTNETIDQLLTSAKQSGVRHVVLTGGEPMLPDAVEPLAQALTRAGMHITIETAGTIFRTLPCDLMSISPKLANSTPGEEHSAWRERHERRRLQFDVLQELIDRYPVRQFKFVITGAEDWPEIDAILAKLHGWRDEEIILMPEGVTTPGPALRRTVLERCLSHNWRYGQRLHIELFGNTRGT